MMNARSSESRLACILDCIAIQVIHFQYAHYGSSSDIGVAITNPHPDWLHLQNISKNSDELCQTSLSWGFTGGYKEAHVVSYST